MIIQLLHDWYLQLFAGSFGHWIAFLPVAIVGAIVLARLGSGLGLDRLFWSDYLLVRLRAGVFLGVLLITSMIVGFLLDYRSQVNPERPFGTLTRSCIRNLILFCVLGTVLGCVGRLFTRPPNPQEEDLQAAASKAPRRSWGDWLTLLGPTLLVAIVFILAARIVSGWLDPILDAPAPVTSNVHNILSWLEPVVDAKRRLFGQPHLADAQLAVHALATLLLLYWLIYWLGQASDKALIQATPAIALCFLASMVTLIGGLIQFNSIPGLFPLALFLLFGLIRAVMPGGIYTFRVRGLTDQYAHPVELRFKGSPAEPPAFPTLPLEMTGHVIEPSLPNEPLVIVCCSGGGIRSAVWAIRCLTQLEQAIPTFASRVRVIFGASGGMLGATRWVTWHDRRIPEYPEQMIGQVEKDALSRLTSAFIFRDIPAGILPVRTWNHRGNVVEDNWRENFSTPQVPFQAKFENLKEHERKGVIPSIVYSPMMVEDARRLLISNLNLSFLSQVYGPELKRAAAGTTLFSQSALEFRSVFGDAALSEFDLLTAVRLNASFPYVMPASSIPTKPRRRVVDAGYYDNYGVGLAADWLLATLNDPQRWGWLRNNASGVLVVQLRDGVLNLTRPLGQTMPDEHNPNPIMHAIEPIATPIQGLMGFKGAVQLFDNDVRLSRVLTLLNDRYKSENGSRKGDFATSVSFEFALDASLTWALTEEELGNLASQASAGNTKFRERIEDIRAWW